MADPEWNDRVLQGVFIKGPYNHLKDKITLKDKLNNLHVIFLATRLDNQLWERCRDRSSWPSPKTWQCPVEPAIASLSRYISHPAIHNPVPCLRRTCATGMGFSLTHRMSADYDGRWVQLLWLNHLLPTLKNFAKSIEKERSRQRSGEGYKKILLHWRVPRPKWSL